jgi:predicted nucleic acid-binding protein
MTRYVIGPDVVLLLARGRVDIPAEHQLLAPALIRSQLLSQLYADVRAGRLTKKDAEDQLDYVRSLRLRLLGDRVLQKVAWRIADELDWADMFDAEYAALTRLQADAFITLDGRLANALEGIVPTASIDALIPMSGRVTKTE